MTVQYTSLGFVKTKSMFAAAMRGGFAGVTGFITSGLNYGPLGVLNVLPFVNLPIFNAGGLLAGVDLAEAQTQEAILRYQQTVQQAVREVADGWLRSGSGGNSGNNRSSSPRRWGMPAR
jgi:hypothetical protein